MNCTEVNVLNVGAGSCTIVRHAHSNHITMVDINDGGDQRAYESSQSEQPLTDPIEWCQTHYGKSLFRFILSHPDADHMAGMRRVLVTDGFDITNFWDLPHTRRRGEAEFQTHEAWLDWAAYQTMRSGSALDGVTWPKVISPMRSDSRDFWDQDSIQICSPTPDLVAAGDRADTYNDASYVLRFRHGGSSVLLASDVEDTAWNDMLQAGVLAHVKVLIASHHGRKSGFSAEAMDVLQPEIVIVSTAKLSPEHDGISEYKRRCAQVLSTRVDGDISVCLYDDDSVLAFDRDSNILATA